MFDGCYKCYHICPKGCILCLDGECLECEPPLIVVPMNSDCQIEAVCDPAKGWYLDKYDNTCQARCGDMIT